MAKKNNEIVVELRAENRDLAKRLAQSEKQVKSLNGKVGKLRDSMKKSNVVVDGLTSAAAKFGPALVSVGAATEVFDRLTKASQGLNDSLNIAKEQVTAFTDSFFNFLTSDISFDKWVNGFKRIGEAARAAAEAADAEGTYRTFAAPELELIREKYATAIANARNAEYSNADRQKALASARQLVTDMTTVSQSLMDKRADMIRKQLQAALVARGGSGNLDNSLFAVDAKSGTVKYNEEAKRYLDRIAARDAEIKKLQGELTAIQRRGNTDDFGHTYYANAADKQAAQELEKHIRLLEQQNDKLRAGTKYRELMAIDAVENSEEGQKLLSTYKMLEVEQYRISKEAAEWNKQLAKAAAALTVKETVKREGGKTDLIDNPLMRVSKLGTPTKAVGIDRDGFLEKQAEEAAALRYELEQIELQNERIRESLGAASSMFGSLTSAAQELGASAPAVKALAIATQLLAGAEAIATASKGDPYTLPIRIAAAIASVVAGFASIAANKFATGGIVPGSSYVGDRVPAMVNSGEMILNRAQQAKLFAAIQTGNIGGGGQVQFRISGSQLVGTLNNYNRIHTHN